MHIKRRAIPTFWDIPKSGSKYVAVPSHEQRNSIPLIIVIRNLLKLVKTKKELKKILNEKKIQINGRIVKETNYPVALFDSISIPSIKKHWRAVLKNKRMEMKEISDQESQKRIFKVINKKILPGKKVQINLNNGRNLISSEKIKTGDFVLLDVKSKIMKVISLDKNTEVVVIGGKHIGKSGKIKEIVKEGENIIAKIKSDKEEISTNADHLFALE